jgi:phosphoglycolate phosphatase-like HAD superfamily hydrolase
MSRLVVFDIDGTLLQTATIDEECYAEAIRQEWGFEGISTDWGAYEHSTDNAIAAEIFRARRGREPSDAELAGLRARFVDLLRRRAAVEPEQFRQTEGAAALLAYLPTVGWPVAIATGGWTPSARLKLERAGIDHHAVPAAFACDARPRAEIIRLAVRRAAERPGGAARPSVGYVGDGTWDLRAARELGAGFVGVGTGDRGALLKAHGAAVVADFGDRERFATLLGQALLA